MRKTVLLIAAVVIPIMLEAADIPEVTDRHWTRKYDQYFRKYSKRFFGPAIDWHWFKAQGIAESGLRGNARSWVNAKGIMQLMPRTFAELKKKNPELRNVLDPRWNIAAGIYYDSSMYMKWREDRPFLDRMRFMLGSYNAGFRTILRAQKLSRKYDSVVETGKALNRLRPRFLNGGKRKHSVMSVKLKNLWAIPRSPA